MLNSNSNPKKQFASATLGLLIIPNAKPEHMNTLRQSVILRSSSSFLSLCVILLSYINPFITVGTYNFNAPVVVDDVVVCKLNFCLTLWTRRPMRSRSCLSYHSSHIIFLNLLYYMVAIELNNTIVSVDFSYPCIEYCRFIFDSPIIRTVLNFNLLIVSDCFFLCYNARFVSEIFCS